MIILPSGKTIRTIKIKAISSLAPSQLRNDLNSGPGCKKSILALQPCCVRLCGLTAWIPAIRFSLPMGYMPSFRYYFQNNANAWLWMLMGNDETKGWETIPSDGKIPEFGGRMQLPVP